MIIWNPYHPDIVKLIEETVGMLSQIAIRRPASSSWNPDRVKGWPKGIPALAVVSQDTFQQIRSARMKTGKDLRMQDVDINFHVFDVEYPL
jgi:hypothetical protein